MTPTPTSQMDWDTVKLFLALHRSGSARAAGVQLNISASTITRKVSQLEKTLHTKLFNRSNGGFELTEHGQDLLQTAMRMENDAYEIERRLKAKKSVMQGSIRITFPNHLVTSPLMGYISEFAMTHPSIAIEAMPSFSSFNLNRGEADIAIRMFLKNGNPPQELIGTELTAVYCANYASTDYLRNHDLSNTQSAHWVGWGEPDTQPEWVLSSQYPKLTTHHKINEPLAQFYAAKASLGLTMLPCFMCDNEPTLQRTPQNIRWHRFDLWMLSHPDLRDTNRFRAFRQHLKQRFSEDKALWTGAAGD